MSTPNPTDLGPVTHLDGFRAAAIAIDNMLDSAKRNLPKRRGGREHLAAWREGYYHGLLSAHCMNVFGEFPQHNLAEIKKHLSRKRRPVPMYQNCPHCGHDRGAKNYGPCPTCGKN